MTDTNHIQVYLSLIPGVSPEALADPLQQISCLAVQTLCPCGDQLKTKQVETPTPHQALHLSHCYAKLRSGMSLAPVEHIKTMLNTSLQKTIFYIFLDITFHSGCFDICMNGVHSVDVFDIKAPFYTQRRHFFLTYLFTNFLM